MFMLVPFFSITGFSQDPVSWKYSAKKIGDKVYELRITATIRPPYHIYSQQNSEDGITLPTKIRFINNPLLKMEGRLNESGDLITRHEPELDIDVKYYANKVEFVQRISLKEDAKTNVSGSIEFMACTDVYCLPPSIVSFNIHLN
jgi:hypothetical protein